MSTTVQDRIHFPERSGVGGGGSKVKRGRFTVLYLKLEIYLELDNGVQAAKTGRQLREKAAELGWGGGEG
jgi:hypothetical protein